jgi:hypothetical protein
MEWDVGVGARAMIRKMVARADMGFSEDDWAFWVMVGQTF